jgi:inosine-uridine nucleoside N-ribohydrolase
LGAPDDGLPDWGPGDDFNLQSDTRAAEVVIAAAHVTFVTLPVAMHAQLRGRELPRLRASGPIGALLAQQSEHYAADTGKRELGVAYPGLADDLVNFHWDPVTAAVAAGWSRASIEDVTLATQVQDGLLTLQQAAHGRQLRVVVDLDADEFTKAWHAAVEAADRNAAERATGRGSVARRAGRGDR